MAKEEQKDQPEESSIQIHTLKTDMEALGIVQEEKKAEPEEETAGATNDPKPEEDQEKAEKKPKETRSQRRIRRQNQRIKDLEAKLEEKEEKKPPTEKKEIDIDDFESYDDYLDALEKEEEPKEEKKETVKVTPDPPAVDQIALNDMFEDGNADYKDFNAKVQSDDLVFSPEMLKEVLKMENPADVAYAIASDPEKSKEIAAIKDPHDLTVAIAKIKTVKTDSDAEVPTKTKAPKPISPVDGNSVKGLSLDDDNLSFEQHEALLAKQQTSTRGGFI